MQNKTIKRKPGSYTADGKTKNDAARHAAPILIINPLKKLENFSLDIAEIMVGTGEFIGGPSVTNELTNE